RPAYSSRGGAELRNGPSRQLADVRVRVVHGGFNEGTAVVMRNRTECADSGLAQVAHRIAGADAEGRYGARGAELAERIHGLFADLPEIVMGGVDKWLQGGLVVELADADGGLDTDLPVLVTQQANERRADLFGRCVDQSTGGRATHFGIAVV